MRATRKSATEQVRVAIYTRVSVSEGLEKEFNSIDAQRSACEAYVTSQRGLGWRALPERYDDGGYTGANTDRPAFQRLLADVKSGLIDCVAVYKFDRLSRNQVEFLQLLDTFRRHEVSFVSITQSFNTSTIEGRAMVSMLALFAQMERETTSARVKDKMLATRRRGMWTGGVPPLGYDVRAKKLVVNQAEAERVREIFALYRSLASLLMVANELNARGVRAKSGGRWTKTSLHALLTNPLLLGKMRAGSELVAGQHEAIIDQETWDATQSLLASRAVTQRGWRPPARNGALLRGLLRCRCGASMIHHSARQKGRVFRYYVCARAMKLGAKTCPRSRASMGKLDAFVVERIRAVGRDPRIIDATLAADRDARDRKRPELEAAVRKVSQERGRAEAARRNVADAIAAGATSMIDRLAELDAELADADQRLAVARRDLAALDVGTVDAEALKRALREFEPLWSELSTAERGRVLGLLLERVEFDGEAGDVEITFRRKHALGAAGMSPIASRGAVSKRTEHEPEEQRA